MSDPNRDLTDAETQRVVDWLKQPLESFREPDPVAPEPSIVEVRCRLAAAFIAGETGEHRYVNLAGFTHWVMTGIWQPPAPPPKPKDQPEG